MMLMEGGVSGADVGLASAGADGNDADDSGDREEGLCCLFEAVELLDTAGPLPPQLEGVAAKLKRACELLDGPAT